MSEFITHCPECHQKILGDTKHLGQRVACPLCDQMFYLLYRYNPVSPLSSSSCPEVPPSISGPETLSGQRSEWPQRNAKITETIDWRNFGWPAEGGGT